MKRRVVRTAVEVLVVGVVFVRRRLGVLRDTKPERVRGVVRDGVTMTKHCVTKALRPVVEQPLAQQLLAIEHHEVVPDQLHLLVEGETLRAQYGLVLQAPERGTVDATEWYDDDFPEPIRAQLTVADTAQGRSARHRRVGLNVAVHRRIVHDEPREGLTHLFDGRVERGDVRVFPVQAPATRSDPRRLGDMPVHNVSVVLVALSRGPRRVVRRDNDWLPRRAHRRPQDALQARDLGLTDARLAALGAVRHVVRSRHRLDRSDAKCERDDRLGLCDVCHEPRMTGLFRHEHRRWRR